MAEAGRAVQGKQHRHTSLWSLLTFQLKNIGKDKKTASSVILFLLKVRLSVQLPTLPSASLFCLYHSCKRKAIEQQNSLARHDSKRLPYPI